jgi:ABC-type uncharacterized transport system auxiliary subunit
MKKNLFMSIFVAIGFVVCTGCSLFPKNSNIPVSYFDIAAPDKKVDAKAAEAIDIKDFKTTNPYNDRMVFRTSPTHLEIDEYNRWGCPPEDMLKRYFTLAFDDNGAMKKFMPNVDHFQLLAKILCLETNLNTKVVKLVVQVELMKESTSVVSYSCVFTEEKKINNVTAENCAETVKILTDRIIAKIANDVLTFQK